MARNEFIKQINSDYISPLLIESEIAIGAISDVVILKDNIGTNRYDYTSPLKITAIKPDGSVINIANNAYTRGTLKLDLVGVYTIKYSGTIRHYYEIAFEESDFGISFNIVATKNYDPLPKWTIASVIDRVLNLCESHLQSIQPRFHLDASQHDIFNKIQSPEFFFTKKSLKEILDQIGGFIHGVPRLVIGDSGKFDTIHYDMLGGTE